MALRVPDQQIAPIKALAELSDAQVEGFLDALSNVGPKFNVFDLSADLSKRLGLPMDVTRGVVQVLASLYLTRDWKKPVETFVDEEVGLSLKRSGVLAPESFEVQWKKLRKFLVAALSLERTVGTASKAGQVLTQHERVFTGAKVMTDLRPIYHGDVSEKPDAAVIVHMLKIGQRDSSGGNRKELFFALDSNDILLMKDLMERALQKDATLRRIMEDSGVTVLNPGLVF